MPKSLDVLVDRDWWCS